MTTAESPICLVCGAQLDELWASAWDAEYFTTSDSFGYYRCADCEALSIFPVPRNRLSEIYPTNYYSYSGSGAQSFAKRIKAKLDARMLVRICRTRTDGPVRVLDVGGGAGAIWPTVREATELETVHIVDLDEQAAAAAEANGCEYTCSRIEDFNEHEKFSVIVALNLIEHVDCPTAVLAKFSRLLAPDGRILIKTPNYGSLDARLFRHGNWAGYHCPRHWVLFTRQSLRRSALTAGLEIARFSYTQGAPFWAKSILFALHERKLIRAGRSCPIPSHPLNASLAAMFAAVDFLRMPFAPTSQMIAEFRLPGVRLWSSRGGSARAVHHHRT